MQLIYTFTTLVKVSFNKATHVENGFLLHKIRWRAVATQTNSRICSLPFSWVCFDQRRVRLVLDSTPFETFNS